LKEYRYIVWDLLNSKNCKKIAKQVSKGIVATKYHQDNQQLIENNPKTRYHIKSKQLRIIHIKWIRRNRIEQPQEMKENRKPVL
jgi:hypothetical protein